MGDRRSPAVVIADARTGSTFLCTCLSTHPQIFCPRTELLGEFGADTFLGVDPVMALRYFHFMPLYDVCMFKLMCRQITDEIYAYLQEIRPKIIYLTRDSLLAQCLSQIMTGMIGSGELDRKSHTFEETPPAELVIDPKQFMNALFNTSALKIFWRTQLEGMPMIEVTYEEMTGGHDSAYMNQDAADEICDFLEVERMPLSACGLRATNPYPPSIVVKNWGEISGAIKEYVADLEQMLEKA